MRALVVVLLAGCHHDAPPPVAPTNDLVRPDGSVPEWNPTRTSHTPRPQPTAPRPQPDATASAECQALVPALTAMFGQSAAFQNRMSDIVSAMTTSCTQDAWSTDVITCFVDARDEAHVNKCTRLFTHDQADKLQQRLMSAMTSTSTPSSP